MKKCVALLLLLFFLLIFSNNRNSFAYMTCDNNIIYPVETSTLNLSEYLSKIDYKEINYFCSYDYCYNVKESNIVISISNFNKIYNNKIDEEYRLITNVKGYPITKISLNLCS